jgi:hypothetical protein
MKEGESALSLNGVLRPQRKKSLPLKTLRSTSSLIAEETVSLVERTEHTAESDKPSHKESDKPSHKESDKPSRIKFDSKALALAVSDSRTEIQKMADAKGQKLITSRSTKYMAFQLAAAEAAIPSCTGNDALKHDPITVSGFSVGLSGFLALPHVAHAALTGKCR